MADNERYYLSHKCENKRCCLFFLTMVIVIDSDIYTENYWPSSGDGNILVCRTKTSTVVSSD